MISSDVKTWKIKLTDSCMNYTLYTVKGKKAGKEKLLHYLSVLNNLTMTTSLIPKMLQIKPKMFRWKEKLHHSCGHHRGRKLDQMLENNKRNNTIHLWSCSECKISSKKRVLLAFTFEREVRMISKMLRSRQKMLRCRSNMFI